jgi:hypothetical protein
VTFPVSPKSGTSNSPLSSSQSHIQREIYLNSDPGHPPWSFKKHLLFCPGDEPELGLPEGNLMHSNSPSFSDPESLSYS